MGYIFKSQAKKQLNISWKTVIVLQATMVHSAAFKDAYEL